MKIEQGLQYKKEALKTQLLLYLLMENELDSAKQQLLAAAESLDLDKNTVNYLSEPVRILQDDIAIKRVTGDTDSFNAYRVQHNDALGPFKGGVRFHPKLAI